MRSPAFDDALRGFRASIPFWLGFIPLGFILGAQASRQGMSAVTAGFMAFFNYAGGSEFAAVALWSAAPPVLLIALTTWLINSRHIVLGAALSIYTRRQSFLENAFLFFLMCDEVWAVSMKSAGAAPKARPTTRPSPTPFTSERASASGFPGP